MRKYKVICSQIVFSEAFIEANNMQEAEELAYEDNHDWKDIHFGEWQIESVKAVKKEIENA